MTHHRNGSWSKLPGLPLFVSRFILPSVLALPSATLLADPDKNSGYADGVDFLSEIPIVTSATRLNQKITEVPSSITIIDREMIEASGATEVAQLLRLVPGYLSYYVIGNQFGVTNRGLTFEFPGDLEVMIDGRSVYEPLFAAVEWSSLGITVQDIDHLEVVRGSNAPAYGSNAYLGAINIVTTNALQSKGTSLSTTWGDLQTRDSQLRHSGHLGAIDYTLGITYRYNEGFPSLSPQSQPFDRIQDSNEALHVTFKGIYAPSLSDTIEFQAGVGESDIDSPGDDISDEAQGFNEREFKNNYQLIRWTRNLKQEDELRIQFYHNRLAVTEQRELGPLSEILARTLGVPAAFISIPDILGHPDEDIVTGLDNAISERSDLELQHKLRITDAQRLVWGAGIRYDRVRSEFLLSRDDSVDEIQYRLFGNWEWTPHQDWRFNLGAMAENNNIAGNFISPRGAVNYQFLPGQVIQASYTYGNRTPSILEANQFQAVRFSDGSMIDADVRFDEDIQESKVNEYQLGYLGEFFSSKLSLDVRLFRTETNDAIGEYIDIFPDLNGSIAVVSNVAEWVTKGVDTQIQLRPDDSTLLSLQYAYSDYGGSRFKRADPLEFRLLDKEIPRHNANLLASKSFNNGWETSFVWYYLSDVAWRQGDLIKAHDRLDFRLAKSFKVGNSSAKAELIVHNLLNEYPEFEDYNIFDTRVFLRLGFDIP